MNQSKGGKRGSTVNFQTLSPMNAALGAGGKVGVSIRHGQPLVPLHPNKPLLRIPQIYRHSPAFYVDRPQQFGGLSKQVKIIES